VTVNYASDYSYIVTISKYSHFQNINLLLSYVINGLQAKLLRHRQAAGVYHHKVSVYHTFLGRWWKSISTNV